jgi:ABC-2 type transport system permease protein
MATVAARHRRRAGGHRPLPLLLALASRAMRDGRARTVGFAYLFAAVSFLQPVAYRHTYPTLADRVGFARSFAGNKAVVLFYGKAYDLLTIGGYSAWRVGGVLVIFAAVFGLLAAVRAMRGEEDAGRTELVLAGAVGRATLFTASMSAVAAGTLILAMAAFVGLVVGGLPVGGSAYLALAVVSVTPVFAGVGALMSQLAPSRRLALELGGLVVGLSFVLRVIADTASGAAWVRWVSPLGWAEELRPFTGARPWVLVLPAAASALLLVGAARIALARDVGRGLLAGHENARPRLSLLSSPTAHALREERTSLLVWTGAVGALGFVIGVISKSISSVGISQSLRHTLAELGAGSALTPKAYIGFSFSFFVVAVSALAVSQIAAARHEELEERLETVLALPVSRRRWLGGRMALGCLGVAIVALAAGVFTWLGAVTQGVSLSLPRMLEAGVNCLPVAILFLGVSGLTYALLPRAGTGIAYGVLIVAYLWQLVGSLLGVPHWLVNATPFAHVGLVPAGSLRWGSAGVMLAIGLLAGVAAVELFTRRDLTGA